MIKLNMLGLDSYLERNSSSLIALARRLFVSLIISFPQITHAEFLYERVQYRVSYVDGKYIGLSATFYNVTTDVLTKPKPQFTIGFDGDMKIGYFKSTRFDESSFHIPNEVSFVEQPGKFFIYPGSVQDGSIRKFLNYLSTEQQSLVEGACRHFLDEKSIDNLLSSTTQNNRGRNFLSLSKHKYDINSLAAECVAEASKVYARDLQEMLTKLGYNLGNIDGKWGAKSRAALSKYFNDRNLPQSSEVSSNLLRQMSLELNQNKEHYLLSGSEKNSQIFSQPINLKTNLPDFAKNISEKLRAQNTIKIFKAWLGGSEFPSSPFEHRYNLFWTVFERSAGNTQASPALINLHQLNWNMNYTYTSWDDYEGIEKYLTNKRWFHEEEYGDTIAVKFWDKGYPDFLANLAVRDLTRNQAEGIMLDWWRDEGGVLRSTGLSIEQVQKARTRIAKALRNKLKKDAIILGNVGWDFNTTTTEYINGVFLELYKVPGQKEYTYSEIKKMENLLKFYDENLQEPRIIAMAPWRVSELNAPDAISPSSSVNIKYAKLFAAMSVVIPKNGYILYSDNNWDSTDQDYGNVYYDFYGFDVGKPTSGFIKSEEGVGYKEHEHGFVAYNINKSDAQIKRKSGQLIMVPAKSGLFCRDQSDKVECLSVN